VAGHCTLFPGFLEHHVQITRRGATERCGRGARFGEKPAVRRCLPLLLLALVILAACGGAEQRDAKVGPSAPITAPEPPAGAKTVLAGSMNSVDGTPVALDEYVGKVVLVVNTASRCGYTSQYGDLQKIYERYGDQGFVVLGFPSNDFQQEYADDGEIKTFCSTNFDVTFPLFSRSSVIGPDANPVFAALAAEPDDIGAPPEWNFTKYLLDRDGLPVARWASNMDPAAPTVTNVIEALLAEQA
jgi:glutathione peroxidase